jgi:predicted TIM-barrel fold metal-dependent hydrolase
MTGWIDYWCNAFTPDRLARWEAAIAAQGIPLKIRRRDDDSFADVSTMVARMDELGVETLLLPSADVVDGAAPTDYALFTTRFEDVVKWSEEHPGRFAGLFTLDPTGGARGLRRAAEALSQPSFVGLQIHTHSWDREFDHRDYYPYYALAAEHEVPVVMQAGASGGRDASECGRPIGIDRPAIYFESVDFVLSHTGWPWVEEALAMAGKHANVFLGTAAFPPHHWSAELARFIAGAGSGKAMLGTSFPVVGHRHALGRLADLEFSPEALEKLLHGTARRVFSRLTGLARKGTEADELVRQKEKS